MAIDSSKYVRVENIYQRLTKIIKQREIPMFDIVDWCAECELDEIGIVRDMWKYTDVEVTIADYQSALPTNCWHVIAVKKNNQPVNFYNNGNYLNFKYNYSNVYLDYYGVPIDSDTGYPLIVRGHEDACMKYCLKMLFTEDYLTGAIDQNRWNTIENSYQDALSLATSKSSRISKNERIKVLEAMRVIKYNYRNLTQRDA